MLKLHIRNGMLFTFLSGFLCDKPTQAECLLIRRIKIHTFECAYCGELKIQTLESRV